MKQRDNDNKNNKDYNNNNNIWKDNDDYNICNYINNDIQFSFRYIRIVYLTEKVMYVVNRC